MKKQDHPLPVKPIVTGPPEPDLYTDLPQPTPIHPSILEKLARVEDLPGVYLMKDDTGRIIYVGKALSLKKRLSSYFTRTKNHVGPHDIKTLVLVSRIASFDTVLTQTEKEALILESNLIKKYRPRYNVMLKDDKRYPSLRLNPDEPYPRLTIVRKIGNDKAWYFGPFASAKAVRQSLRFIHKTFRLRKCGPYGFKNRTRPCINYQMGLCYAPCCLDVPLEVYGEAVREVALFLRGKTPELVRRIRRKMMEASENQEYEKAAELRDRLFSLEKTLERQISVTTDFMDRDVVAAARAPEASIVTLLMIRSGRLMGTRHFEFAQTLAADSELIGAFIQQYYETGKMIPKEILTAEQLEGRAALEEWLQENSKKKIKLLWPQRGEKKRMAEMTRQNAEAELKDRVAAYNKHEQLLTRLQKRLRMARVPRRIECFDNSNIMGTSAVSGMVVFQGGKPDKDAYRRYQIKKIMGRPDDYGYMAEVLQRRYGKGDLSQPFPDLLLVDGGKGQLNIALAILSGLGLEREFQVAGIAKKDELKGETQDKIYLPNRSNPVGFGKENDLLLFLQRVRDEAHRFAIAFHRKKRAKAQVKSALDAVAGIGEKRKKALLRHFGSIKKIRAASMEELCQVPEMSRPAALALKAHFSPPGQAESSVSQPGKPEPKAQD